MNQRLWIVALAALTFACNKGSSGDSAASSASAAASTPPAASAQPSASVATTATAPPTTHPVTHPSTATPSAPPLPAASVDQISQPGLGNGGSECPPSWKNCCPPGWVSPDGYTCNRPCKKDTDCHGANKCKQAAAGAYCAH